MVRAERITNLDERFTTLPLAVVRQIDELADEFESAWRSARPRIRKLLLGGLRTRARRRGRCWPPI